MKKLIGTPLIILGIAVATLTATTAYTPLVEGLSLDPPLTLSSPAGAQVDDPTQPIVAAGTTLTVDTLQSLTDAKVARVRVKEFAFARWPERWWFVLACVSLLVGSLLMRHSAADALAAAGATATNRATADVLKEVVEALTRVRAIVDEDAPLGEACRTIETLQRGALGGFVEDRQSIADRHGLARLARVMDRFAAGDRLVNRSWSAAADGYRGETSDCLGRAIDAFEDARLRLEA